MDFDQLMGATQRLTVSVETLAAVVAALRISAEGLQAPKEVAERVRAVAAEAGIEGFEGLPVAEQQAAIGVARAFFRQAADLIDHPDREPGWLTDDPSVLQSQGRASMVVATLIQGLAPGLGGLADRLSAAGARALDIGTGVGWLAVALATAYPNLHVTGIDVADRPLELARVNVRDVGLGERIDLRVADASELDEPDVYDLAWVPGPFLNRASVPAILGSVHRALRPGGWVVFGLYAAADEALAASLTELRVIRSGGHPWTPEAALGLLTDAGFEDAMVPARTWAAPLDFAVGRHP